MNSITKDFYEKSEGEKEISWEEVEQASCEIVKKMKAEGFEPDVIISIARSGLIPGSLISYALGNKELYTIKIDFSKSQKIGKDQDMRHKPKISQELSKDIEGLNVLVIDEMVVSGSTLNLVKDYMGMKSPKDVRYAVLYKQPWSKFDPHYFGVETKMWPIFPWKRLKKNS